MQPINLNLFTRVTAEGTCSQAHKVAFQTSNFSPKTAKEVVANMGRLSALLEAGTIQEGVPFYLPCVITRAAAVSAADAEIDSILLLDGTRVEVASADAAEANEGDSL